MLWIYYDDTRYNWSICFLRRCFHLYQILHFQDDEDDEDEDNDDLAAGTSPKHTIQTVLKGKVGAYISGLEKIGLNLFCKMWYT